MPGTDLVLAIRSRRTTIQRGVFIQRDVRVRQLAFINGFRALAAIWVVICHCLIWSAWDGPMPPSAKYAVDLFIIISGYLMMLQAHRRDLTEPMHVRQSQYRFYLRRFFRIAPVYYFALACAIASAPFFLGGYAVLHQQNPVFAGDEVYSPANVVFTGKNILLHATFLFGLLPDYAFSTFLPDWSISLEMQFYAVFPLIYLFMRRLGTLRTVLYLCVPCVLLSVVLGDRHGPHGVVGLFIEPSFLPLKLAYFVAGMIIARTGLEDASDLQKCGLWFLAITLLLGDVWMQRSNPLIVPGLAIAMLFATTFPRSRIRSLLDRLGSLRLVEFASRMSYAVYLFHGFMVAGVGYFIFARPGFAGYSTTWRATVMLSIVIPGAYAIGWVVERFVESPGIALGHRLMTQRLPLPVADRAVRSLWRSRL
jgi:peptidoglycan/LPS O-acetylase OafA/YrhL